MDKQFIYPEDYIGMSKFQLDTFVDFYFNEEDVDYCDELLPQAEQYAATKMNLEHHMVYDEKTNKVRCMIKGRDYVKIIEDEMKVKPI